LKKGALYSKANEIGDRIFEAMPSEVVCGICPYSNFCQESVILDSEELS
jgi:hypothetical protein